MVNRNSKKFIKKKSKKSKRTRRIKGGQGGHTFAKAPTGRLPIEGDNRILARFLHEAGLSTRDRGRHIYDGLISLGVERVEDIDVLEPEDFEQVGITPVQQQTLLSHLTDIKRIPRSHAPLLDEELRVEDSVISERDRKIQERLDSSQESVQIIRDYINGLKSELDSEKKVSQKHERKVQEDLNSFQDFIQMIRQYIDLLKSKQRRTEGLLASAEIELARRQERMNKLESELDLERNRRGELGIKCRANANASFNKLMETPFYKAAEKWDGSTLPGDSR
jgi:hypothetical protein